MMPFSLRLRLFLLMSVATGAVWLSAVIWIEHSTRAEVEKVLDARLAEAATMVSSLIADRRIALSAGEGGAMSVPMGQGAGYSRQLSCQIWSYDGDLVGRSEGAPRTQLTAATEPGYSETTVEGEVWRVYTIRNAELGLRIMVGDAVEVRSRLVRDVIEGLVLPAAVILPTLAVLIWLSVAQGLSPLKRLERALRARTPTDLSPLPEGPAPREIRPVRRALNRLFAEVEAARANERDFTAFAAHELKTPLAGLRMQAQIARIAADEPTRSRALAAIETSVDRTDRLVRQLLELAAVERDAAEIAPIDLDALLRDIAADLAHLAQERGVRIEVSVPEGCNLRANRFLLQAALRNLAENAIHAAGDNGAAVLSAAEAGGELRITVDDTGAGIPPDLAGRVTERFFRGPDASHGGSGLGLAIVAAATERMGGSMRFDAAPGGGQRVILTFSAG